MLKFDERALKASITMLLEALHQEDFEGQVRRLQEERRKLQEQRLLLEGERKRRLRTRIASVGVALVLFFAALGQLSTSSALTSASPVVTMLLARVGAPDLPWSGEVVLVGIDEASERAIGRKFGPDWRAEHAVVIAYAASAAARASPSTSCSRIRALVAANAALQAALAATREKLPVVFGVHNASRTATGFGAMLAPFAKLARQGIACLSLEGGQALAMPLAIVRAGVDAAPAPASAGSGGAAGPGGAAPIPAFGLAAYSGGGRVDLVDETEQSVVVRLRTTVRRSQTIEYYKSQVLGGPQPACEHCNRAIACCASCSIRTRCRRCAPHRSGSRTSASFAATRKRSRCSGTASSWSARCCPESTGSRCRGRPTTVGESSCSRPRSMRWRATRRSCASAGSSNGR